MEVLNRSINQTLSRTVITAVMFFLSALALYMYGGSSMEGLAETHMIGAVIVVLSSILVAVPMLTIGFLRVSKQDLLPKAKDVEALARRPVYGVFQTRRIGHAVEQIQSLTGARASHLPGGVVVLT